MSNVSEEEKIDTIMTYYNISYIAARYIYFRRRRSFPWKKKSQSGYLYWNAKLQNALIYADSIFGFDWHSMEYGNEEETLKIYGIDVKTQSNNLFRTKTPKSEYVDNDGIVWNIVVSKKSKEETILKSAGLLPKYA